jgi:hypothetical protein
LSPSSIPEIVSVVKQSSGMIASAAEGRFWLAFWENVLNLSNARNASHLDTVGGQVAGPQRVTLAARVGSAAQALPHLTSTRVRWNLRCDRSVWYCVPSVSLWLCCERGDLTYAPDGPPGWRSRTETGSPIDILRTGPRSQIGGQIDATPAVDVLPGKLGMRLAGLEDEGSAAEPVAPRRRARGNLVGHGCRAPGRKCRLRTGCCIDLGYQRFSRGIRHPARQRIPIYHGGEYGRARSRRDSRLG